MFLLKQRLNVKIGQLYNMLYGTYNMIPCDILYILYLSYITTLKIFLLLPAIQL